MACFYSTLRNSDPVKQGSQCCDRLAGADLIAVVSDITLSKHSAPLRAVRWPSEAWEHQMVRAVALCLSPHPALSSGQVLAWTCDGTWLLLLTSQEEQVCTVMSGFTAAWREVLLLWAPPWAGMC